MTPECNLALSRSMVAQQYNDSAHARSCWLLALNEAQMFARYRTMFFHIVLVHINEAMPDLFASVVL